MRLLKISTQIVTGLLTSTFLHNTAVADNLIRFTVDNKPYAVEYDSIGEKYRLLWPNTRKGELSFKTSTDKAAAIEECRLTKNYILKSKQINQPIDVRGLVSDRYHNLQWDILGVQPESPKFLAALSKAVGKPVEATQIWDRQNNNPMKIEVLIVNSGLSDGFKPQAALDLISNRFLVNFDSQTGSSTAAIDRIDILCDILEGNISFKASVDLRMTSKQIQSRISNQAVLAISNDLNSLKANLPDPRDREILAAAQTGSSLQRLLQKDVLQFGATPFVKLHKSLINPVSAVPLVLNYSQAESISRSLEVWSYPVRFQLMVVYSLAQPLGVQ